ncbi:MAG: hypothetical protein LBS92_04855 [Candidatus Methanoplasma sp.]|jgi:hypothetical protein|nr:hypothetical protein [Candidatus Methanoplasma sp.]
MSEKPKSMVHSVAWRERAMSKYDALWNHVQKNGPRSFKMSFDEIGDITGIEIDRSFLKCKKELTAYGYPVGKISLREKTVIFNKDGE